MTKENKVKLIQAYRAAVAAGQDGIADMLEVVIRGETGETTTYDELGNERHKAVRELRGISVDELCKKYDYIDVYPEFIWSIRRAIGLRHGAGFEEIISRLIHLLGGDECNFSAPESDVYDEDAETNPAETSGDADNYVVQITDQSQALASMGQDNETKYTVELDSQEKEASPNIWYDVTEHEFWITTSDKPPTDHSVNLQDAIDSILRKTGSVEDTETPESVKNLQEVAEMGEGEAPIASITDELREWLKEHGPYEDDSVFRVGRFGQVGAERLCDIADRIDKAHQDAMQSVHDAMETECNRLSEELEVANAAIANWRERGRSFHESERMREKLLEEVKGLKQAAERDAEVIESLRRQLSDLFGVLNCKGCKLGEMQPEKSLQ